MVLCIHPEVLRLRPHGCDSMHRCASVVTFPQMQTPATALTGIYVASVGVFLLFTGLTDLSFLKKKKALCFPNRLMLAPVTAVKRPKDAPWSLPGVALVPAWCRCRCSMGIRFPPSQTAACLLQGCVYLYQQHISE